MEVIKIELDKEVVEDRIVDKVSKLILRENLIKPAIKESAKVGLNEYFRNEKEKKMTELIENSLIQYFEKYDVECFLYKVVNEVIHSLMLQYDKDLAEEQRLKEKMRKKYGKYNPEKNE